METIRALRAKLATTERKLADTERELKHARAQRVRPQTPSMAQRERSTPTLGELLDERGCKDPGERRAVLEGLTARQLDALLSISVASYEAVTRLLDEEVIFASRALPSGRQPAALVQVEPGARCELGSESDLRTAFDWVVEMCERLQIKRVRIVGGSPTYHTQLKALAKDIPGSPRLHLVQGDRARVGQGTKRQADLSVTWGGTILDHAVSAQYRGGVARQVLIVNRGLTGMLLELSESLGRMCEDEGV